MATFDDSPRFKCRPHTPHDCVLYATAVLAPRSTRSSKGLPRSRTSRFNVARLPATPTRPSRGPWLAIGLCCPVGSSLTTASSESLDPSPPLSEFAAEAAAPKEIGFGRESRGFPIYSAGLCSRAASLTPVTPKSVHDCSFLFSVSPHHPVTGSAITLISLSALTIHDFSKSQLGFRSRCGVHMGGNLFGGPSALCEVLTEPEVSSDLPTYSLERGRSRC
jgi:hypothetical protein